MRTRKVPETEWRGFLDRFSSRHQGWVMNLEVFGPDIGAQVEGTGLVLEGLTDEWNEVKGNTITIMAGTRSDEHVTHSISHPTEICLETTDGGEETALLIKREDGTTTLLTFSSLII